MNLRQRRKEQCLRSSSTFQLMSEWITRNFTVPLQFGAANTLSFYRMRAISLSVDPDCAYRFRANNRRIGKPLLQGLLSFAFFEIRHVLVCGMPISYIRTRKGRRFIKFLCSPESLGDAYFIDLINFTQQASNVRQMKFLYIKRK